MSLKRGVPEILKFKNSPKLIDSRSLKFIVSEKKFVLPFPKPIVE